MHVLKINLKAEHTGEEPLHNWMDPKKVKSLVLCL